MWIWEQTAIISLYSINWLVSITETECLLRGTDWVFIYNSGYVFCVDLRTKSDYFPLQHWLVCITETECVYCAVRAEYLYINRVICCIWISKQTSIISLYSINWLIFIIDTECWLRGTDWMCIMRVNLSLRSAHTVQLCVLCGSQNKRRLFPNTALTGWLL